MKTPHNMTVYQKSIVSGAESWTRVQVVGVMWENLDAVRVTANGTMQADDVSVFVPFSSAILSIKEGDVLVKGLVSDEISPSFTISALKKKYADVVTVRRVYTRDYGSKQMQHLQIGAS